MQVIKCSKCGNANDFYEKMPVIRHNYFHQGKDGWIEKVSSEISDSPIHDSQIFCSICNEDIGEDYDSFLNRYTEALFDTSG